MMTDRQTETIARVSGVKKSGLGGGGGFFFSLGGGTKGASGRQWGWVGGGGRRVVASGLAVGEGNLSEMLVTTALLCSTFYPRNS